MSGPKVLVSFSFCKLQHGLNVLLGQPVYLFRASRRSGIARWFVTTIPLTKDYGMSIISKVLEFNKL